MQHFHVVLQCTAQNGKNRFGLNWRRVEASGQINVAEFNLETLTLSQKSDIRYSPGNTAKFGNSTEIGSTIKSGGSLALAAANDINARATRIDAEGDLSLKAGNDITLSAGRNEQFIKTSGHSETKSKKLFGSSKESKDFSLEANTLTALVSTLSGKNVSLETGNTGTLATQGSRITATEDLSVKAGTILLDAAYDAERSNSSSSIMSKTTRQKSEQKESLTATGSILSAGRNLSLESSGDTTVIGSALAAEQKVTIKTGGNLALLAAESSSERKIDDYVQTKKRATTLAFEQQDVRQLLSTITVGSGLNIEVGGNFTADIGEKNPDGSLIADRMTVDSVVRGTARQQVDVKTTGVGANSNASSSKVLGALSGAGIRNGANDSFAPKAAVIGGDALQQYLNSGLVQIQNNPQLAEQLKHVLSNPGGASLTYKDDSGNISLTVAGQAKVQEVFNTLKLSESFDTKKLTDQGTAQIVTLVAAVVLTVCTAGAGAAVLALAEVAANATAALMIDAAIVGMSSTMIGQLAGGASFDKAFQAGVKAGATSALMAGVSAGIGELVGSPPTTQVGGSTVQAGTNAASSTTSSFQAMGTSQYWAQTSLNALAKGTLASAQGGKFEDGVIGSVLGSLSASGAGIIGDSTSGNPLGNILSHAVLGCTVAAAGKQDCASGAIGGAASATLARVIDAGIGDGLDGKARQAVIAGGAVAGSAAVVGALGGNVMTAGNAASNEVLNNYLSPKQNEDKKTELANCKTVDECKVIEEKWKAIDQKQYPELAPYKDIIEKAKIDWDENLALARTMSGIEFVKAVKTGGDWDYKNNIKKFPNADLLQEFGNFHFGAMAAEHGFSLTTSLFGAGTYQTFFQNDTFSTGIKNGWMPEAILLPDSAALFLTNKGYRWGDNPGDSKAISSGWTTRK